MTDKPKAYNLTPEHFARARADIVRRLKEELHAELARLDADESAAAEIAERYPEALVKEEAKPAAAKSIAKAKRPNTGRPYKPEENARIVGAERGTLEALAEALGRDYPGVLKQHEILLRQHREKTDPRPLVFIPADGSPPPAPEMEKEEEPINWDAYPHPAPPENPGSENSPIVEATAAPRTARPTDPRHVPARVVDTIIDNGPGRPPRVYGPGFA